MTDPVLHGRHRFGRVIGAGDFGRTVEADELQSGRRVAIKMLSLATVDDWKAVERFERESRVPASLDHPSIPKYRDSFQAEGRTTLYLVQDLAPGSSFAELIARGVRLDETELRRVAQQVLEVPARLQCQRSCCETRRLLV